MQPPPLRLPLDEIGALWSFNRYSTDGQYVTVEQEYREHGAELYPLDVTGGVREPVVVRGGFLENGQHRFNAARLAGLKFLPVTYARP